MGKDEEVVGGSGHTELNTNDILIRIPSTIRRNIISGFCLPLAR